MKVGTIAKITGISCLLYVVFFALAKMPPQSAEPLPPGWVGEERRSTFRDIIYHERHLKDGLIQLETNFPKPSHWPNLIFQIDLTSTHGPYQAYSHEASGDAQAEREAMQTWPDMNRGFAYVKFNDSAADQFVESEFSAVPDIVHVYKSFPRLVMKADMLRYLVGWRFGGVYADKDVRCKKPIPEWLPQEIYDHPSVNTVIGVEIDEAFSPDKLEKNALFRWRRGFGFAQYAFMAKPFSASMRQAIIRCTSHAFALFRARGVDRPDASLTYSERDIFAVTGPEMFTDTIIDVVLEASRDRVVTWRNFTGLASPLLDEASGVCVLPINYFGSGQRHSGSKPFGHPDACVNHYFLRTWA